MGFLTMTEAEYQYYVDNMRESFSLIGQEAILYQVESEFKDLYNDREQVYKDGKEISLVFEGNPKPVLKKYNWVAEGEEALVAHVVALANDGTPIEIRENMKILIKSTLGLETEKMFKVSKVMGNHIPPITWICMLVPYRYKTDIDTEKSGYQSIRDNKGLDTDTSFLKVSI